MHANPIYIFSAYFSVIVKILSVVTHKTETS